jgi:hypothetical protein
MNIDLATLPDDVDTLQRMVRTLAAERTHLSEAQAEIERLRLIVQKLQRSQFGRRAERLDSDQLQFSFEDLHADIARVEATLASATVKTQRTRPDRSSLPACPCCGGELHVIGETVKRDARSCAGAASSHPHLPAALWLPGSVELFIRRPPRSVQSPRASPVPVFLLMS